MTIKTKKINSLSKYCTSGPKFRGGGGGGIYLTLATALVSMSLNFNKTNNKYVLSCLYQFYTVEFSPRTNSFRYISTGTAKQLWGGGGGHISDSILGGHNTLFVTNS